MNVSSFSNKEGMSCASCKNKSSFERCSNKCLLGFQFCGKHVKAKYVRVWKDINNLDVKAMLIQKIWRGFSVREWMRVAGPGVLKRQLCHNDEELVTLDDKQSVAPFDYFSFQENEKVYWFDIRSLSELVMSKLKPENPYTREPLTFDTRQRLRKLCLRRKLRHIENLHDSNPERPINEVINTTWIYICQIIEENGFFDMSHLYFTTLNRTQLFIFNSMLQQDLIAWAAEHTNKQSRRYRYVYWMKRVMAVTNIETDRDKISFISARVISTILNDCRDPYSICFIVVSCLHRL
jgi:hypothetical protein